MTLRFRPEAESDLMGIGRYIAQDNPAAAARFVARLRETCMALEANPDMGRARPELLPDLRGFPVGQYVVYYRREDETVEIVRVIHGARDIDAMF